jgi:hypothetical protein
MIKMKKMVMKQPNLQNIINKAETSKEPAGVKLIDNASAGGRRAMGEPEAARKQMNMNRDLRHGWKIPVAAVPKEK